MQQITKSQSQVCLISAIFLLLCGCILYPIIGPGYTVTISVSDEAHLKITDIAFLDHLAEDEGFNNRRVTSSSNRWECVHFDRELDGPQYEQLHQDKFLRLGWCYDVGLEPDTDEGEIKDFYIGIYNDRAGQKPPIKQEIDRLGDVFYKALLARYGAEHITLERKRTGPPF